MFIHSKLSKFTDLEGMIIGLTFAVEKIKKTMNMKRKNDSDFWDFTGAMDEFIVYDWRGLKCLRRRPTGWPDTPPPGARAQQERLAAVAVFFQAMKAAGLYPYWQRAAEGMTAHGYNLVVRENLAAFGADGAIRDFTKLRLTPNLMPLPDGLTLSDGDGDAWLLEWEAGEWLPGTEADDDARLLAMRDAETFVLLPVEAGGALRGDGSARFRLPDGASDFTHLFVYFCSRTDGICTSSRYYNLKSLQLWENKTTLPSRGI